MMYNFCEDLKLTKRKIKIICRYSYSGVPFSHESIIEVISTDLATAREIAINKAKKILSEFSYISNVSVEIKKRSVEKQPHSPT